MEMLLVNDRLRDGTAPNQLKLLIEMNQTWFIIPQFELNGRMIEVMRKWRE